MEIAILGKKNDFVDFKNKIEIFNKEKKIKTYISFYEEIKNLLEDIEKKNFKIIFLIHSNNAPKMFNYCKNIKKIKPDCKIIFCSKTEKFAVEGYKFNISAYLLMPLDYHELKFALGKNLNLNETIIINCNWQKIPIAIDSIHFAEKQGHNILIYTTSKKFSTRITFKEFAKNFKNKKNFINCIRGTIVNLDWVETISLQNFIMKNGEKIPIRRQDRKKLKEILFNFQNEKIAENNF